MQYSDFKQLDEEVLPFSNLVSLDYRQHGQKRRTQIDIEHKKVPNSPIFTGLSSTVCGKEAGFIQYKNNRLFFLLPLINKKEARRGLLWGEVVGGGALVVPSWGSLWLNSSLLRPNGLP